MVFSCACVLKVVPQLSARAVPKAGLASAFKQFAICRLQKIRRLRNNAEFRQVIASKHRESGQYFQAYLKANGFSYTRLGLIVGKRLMRKAVHRNFVKRLIREAFRKQQEAFGGHDVVIRLCTPFPVRRSVAARQELARLFEKLHNHVALDH